MVVHVNGDESHGTGTIRKKKKHKRIKSKKTEDVWLAGIEPTVFLR